MKRSHVIFVTLGSLLVLVALFLSSVGRAAVMPRSDTRAWRGYYPLLVDEAYDCEELIGILGAAGFDPVIAECTATVHVNTFGAVQELPLVSVSDRFDPVDPRIDPYIRELPAWFRTTVRGEPAAILYIASTEAPYRVYRRVSGAMNKAAGGWVFPDWDNGRGMVFPAAFLILAAVLVTRGTGFRCATILAALPWPVLLFRHGLPAFGSAVVIYVAWLSGLELMMNSLRHGFADAARRDQEPSTLRIAGAPILIGLSVPAAAILSTLVAFSAFELTTVVPIVTASAATVAVGLFVVVVRIGRYRRTEHPLFNPVPIVPTSIARPVIVPAALPLVIAIALAAPIVHRLIPGDTDAYLPAPQAQVAVRPLSLDSLAELWAHTGDGVLPNLADYVAHRAYQEGFMYRREFALPAAGETLELVRFVQNGPSVDRIIDRIVEYDQQWLSGVLATRPETGIESMLLAQPYPVRVVLRPTSAIYSDQLSLTRYAVLLLLLAAPFLVLFLRDAAMFRRSRSPLQRSNRQLA